MQRAVGCWPLAGGQVGGVGGSLALPPAPLPQPQGRVEPEHSGHQVVPSPWACSCRIQGLVPVNSVFRV